MKQKFVVIAVGMLWCGWGGVEAQNVISSLGGDVVKSGVGSMSYTLGQSADVSAYDTALTVQTKTAAMTEGVQQGYLSWELLETPNVVDLGVEVVIYPNPTIDGFAIEVKEGVEEYGYELYSVNGVLLQRGEMRDYKRIDLSRYAVGTFMLRLHSTDGKQENNYKIIKSH